MKAIVFLLILWITVSECEGQLVRRVDYDAAFALQVGGDLGGLVPFGSRPRVTVCPMGGLKMTFPFNRKWFLGSEVNYSQLKYTSIYETLGKRATAKFDIKQIQVPVYLKYMLNCNRASILFGLYGAYVFDSDLREIYESNSRTDINDESSNMDKWNAGLTVGYEYQLVKHLNIMFQLSAGAKEVMKHRTEWGKALFPIQACLALSFDVLRIGDCGCD